MDLRVSSASRQQWPASGTTRCLSNNDLYRPLFEKLDIGTDSAALFRRSGRFGPNAPLAQSECFCAADFWQRLIRCRLPHSQALRKCWRSTSALSHLSRRGSLDRLSSRPLLAGAEVLAGAVITAASDEEEKCLRTLSSLSHSAQSNIAFALGSANGERRAEPPRRESGGLPTVVRAERRPAPGVSRGPA